MKKVMLDSSVWLSYILKDSNFERAERLLDKLSSLKIQIVVTNLIIGEITNVFVKKKFTTSKIMKTIKNLNANKLPQQAIFTRSRINKLRDLNLKSMDFLILLEALVYNVDKFYTYDIRQHHAYEKISQKNTQNQNANLHR